MHQSRHFTLGLDRLHNVKIMLLNKKKIIWVIAVLRRTVVGDSRFDGGRGYLQSEVIYIESEGYLKGTIQNMSEHSVEGTT